MRSVALFAVLMLTACGRAAVNPPTEPADPVPIPDQDAGRTKAGAYLPGRGPPTFVGRWAGRQAWCATPAGERRPIQISTTRFEGYENSCAISDIAQSGTGYEVALHCQAEGLATVERVHLSVAGDDLRLTWLTRGGLEVPLKRCPTPEVKAPQPMKP